VRPKNFISKMQRKVAISAVGPSAVRGRKGGKIIKVVHDFLAETGLASVPRTRQAEFLDWLDQRTSALQDRLPARRGKKRPRRPWGIARKAINLFLRDAVYNKYLSGRFGLDRLEAWLELPLDSQVARRLRQFRRCCYKCRAAKRSPSRRSSGEVWQTDCVCLGWSIAERKRENMVWPGLRDLVPKESKRFQKCASILACLSGTKAVDLDLYLWRSEPNHASRASSETDRCLARPWLRSMELPRPKLIQ